MQPNMIPKSTLKKIKINSYYFIAGNKNVFIIIDNLEKHSEWILQVPHQFCYAFKA